MPAQDQQAFIEDLIARGITPEQFMKARAFADKMTGKNRQPNIDPEFLRESLTGGADDLQLRREQITGARPPMTDLMPQRQAMTDDLLSQLTSARSKAAQPYQPGTSDKVATAVGLLSALAGAAGVGGKNKNIRNVLKLLTGASQGYLGGRLERFETGRDAEFKGAMSDLDTRYKLLNNLFNAQGAADTQAQDMFSKDMDFAGQSMNRDINQGNLNLRREGPPEVEKPKEPLGVTPAGLLSGAEDYQENQSKNLLKQILDILNAKYPGVADKEMTVAGVQQLLDTGKLNEKIHVVDDELNPEIRKGYANRGYTFEDNWGDDFMTRPDSSLTDLIQQIKQLMQGDPLENQGYLQSVDKATGMANQLRGRPTGPRLAAPQADQGIEQWAQENIDGWAMLDEATKEKIRRKRRSEIGQ